MRSVGQQVIVGAAAHDLGKALTDFAIEKAHDLAHALQRESLAAQFADDGHFGEMVHRIESAMAFAPGLYDATFVPPLELPSRDPGQGYHLLRCEPILHGPPVMFETNTLQNVSNILGMEACGSLKNRRRRGD